MIILIEKRAIDSALVASQNIHPKEFISLFTGSFDKETETYTLEDLIIAPLSQSDFHSSSFNPYLLPVAMETIATFHSHPSGVPIPSLQDLAFFAKNQPIHLIAGFPYVHQTTKAYDRNGKEIEIKIIKNKTLQKNQLEI